MIGGLVARHTIVVVRAPLVDDGRGNKARDWTAATETPSSGWAVDAGSGGEDTVNRDGSSIEYTIRGPIDADLRATDRVRLMGGLYEVDGGVGPPARSFARHIAFCGSTDRLGGLMSVKSVRIKLNRSGVIALLQSQAVENNLAARAERIAAAAGEGFEVDETTNRDRAVVFVRTATTEARVAEAEDRALSRAINAGR